jgi:hypothetical protein
MEEKFIIEGLRLSLLYYERNQQWVTDDDGFDKEDVYWIKLVYVSFKRAFNDHLLPAITQQEHLQIVYVQGMCHSPYTI